MYMSKDIISQDRRSLNGQHFSLLCLPAAMWCSDGE